MAFFLIHSHTCFSIERCSSHSEVRRHHQELREQTHQGLSLFISNLCYETHFYIESTFRESISIGASLKNFQLHNSKSIAVSGKEKLQWRSDGFDASRDWFWWSIIFFYEWRLGICCVCFYREESESDEHFTRFSIHWHEERARALKLDGKSKFSEVIFSLSEWNEKESLNFSFFSLLLLLVSMRCEP